jgi:beta-lactamase superfamily II metal-dependent hydrolase
MDGDCTVLSWGEASPSLDVPPDRHHPLPHQLAHPLAHHLVVDLGRAATYQAIRPRLQALGHVELFVMSHIDADHIGGAMPLVRENTPPFAPKRVWFNARPQLVAAENRAPILEPLSARQGEKLSRGIVRFGWPWNAEFASEIASTDSPEAAQPIRLAGGLTVRLLSPGDAQLVALLPDWDAELDKARIRTFDPDEELEPLAPHLEALAAAPNVKKLAEEDYAADRTTANGASIAILAELEGRRILIAADAHSEVLESSIAPLAAAEGGRLRVDLLKISHHGSKANTSKAFPALLDCTHFAVSTNGTRRHAHPDPQTIARFLVADPNRQKTFYCNYRQPSAEAWESPLLQARWHYHCVFPVTDAADPGNGTLVVEV